MAYIPQYLRPKTNTDQFTGNFWFYNGAINSQTQADCTAADFFENANGNPTFRDGDLLYIKASDSSELYTVDVSGQNISLSIIGGGTSSVTEYAESVNSATSSSSGNAAFSNGLLVSANYPSITSNTASISAFNLTELGMYRITVQGSCKITATPIGSSISVRPITASGSGTGTITFNNNVPVCSAALTNVGATFVATDYIDVVNIDTGVVIVRPSYTITFATSGTVNFTNVVYKVEKIS